MTPGFSLSKIRHLDYYEKILIFQIQTTILELAIGKIWGERSANKTTEGQSNRKSSPGVLSEEWMEAQDMCSAQSLSRSHPDRVRLLGWTGHLQGCVSSSRIDMKGEWARSAWKIPAPLLKDGVCRFPTQGQSLGGTCPNYVYTTLYLWELNIFNLKGETHWLIKIKQLRDSRFRYGWIQVFGNVPKNLLLSLGSAFLCSDVRIREAPTHRGPSCWPAMLPYVCHISSLCRNRMHVFW